MRERISILIFATLVISVGWYTYSVINGEQSIAQQIADGEYLGFIHTVNISEHTIVFNDAMWLYGKEGQDAAIRAGICTEETRTDCLPNDYYIGNINGTDTVLALDPRGSILMKTYDAGDVGIVDKAISTTEFSQLINNETLPWRKLPYLVTTEGGYVMRIEEVFVP